MNEGCALSSSYGELWQYFLLQHGGSQAFSPVPSPVISLFIHPFTPHSVCILGIYYRPGAVVDFAI